MKSQKEESNIMSTPTPLEGPELIDCARANGNEGIERAAERCGYGQDLETFNTKLKQACQAIGVEFNHFNDLLKSSTNYHQDAGFVVAPETPSQL